MILFKLLIFFRPPIFFQRARAPPHNFYPVNVFMKCNLPFLPAMFVPLLGQRIGFALTAILGAIIIVLSLVTASFIDTAAMLFIP